MASAPYPLFSTRKRPHGRRNERSLPQEPSISDINTVFSRRKSFGQESGDTTRASPTKLHDSETTAPLSLYDSAESSSAFSYHDSVQTSHHGSFRTSSAQPSMHGSNRTAFSSLHDSGMTSLQSFETSRESWQDGDHDMVDVSSFPDESQLSRSSLQYSFPNAPNRPPISRMGSKNDNSDESVDGRETKRAHLLQNESKPNGDPGKKKATLLRRKQLRLLLLRHATLCEISPGEECPVTRRCSDAKALCNHIMICADPHCSFPRCLTSREVLGHHRKCADASCEICLPLRRDMSQMKVPDIEMEIIHDRNDEKQQKFRS